MPWWAGGAALVAGATGAALLWTGLVGATPDWIDDQDQRAVAAGLQPAGERPPEGGRYGCQEPRVRSSSTVLSRGPRLARSGDLSAPPVLPSIWPSGVRPRAFFISGFAPAATSCLITLS